MQKNTEKQAAPTDEQFYRLFIAGDAASYEELMTRLGDGLIIYINGYLHDWHDSEELMIDTFARIMAKEPLIHGSFKAYLYKTARNLAVRFKAARRTAEFCLDDVDEDLTDGTFPEDIVFGEERRRTLHLCLDRIDPHLKEALWLVYCEGLSYSDAAGVMHISVRNIDKLLQRGKERMREELGKEGITNAF